MDVREWMEEEYAIVEGKKQGSTKREYLRTRTFWLSSETSCGDFIRAEKKKQEEKEV